MITLSFLQPTSKNILPDNRGSRWKSGFVKFDIYFQQDRSKQDIINIRKQSGSLANRVSTLHLVPGLSQHKQNGCHHQQIGMDFFCDVIFKMDSLELVKLSFRLYSTSRIDRDDTLVSAPMFWKIWIKLIQSLWPWVNSKFKMAVIETSENHIFCHILAYRINR